MREDLLAPEVFGCLQQAMASDPRGLADLCRDYLADARRTLELLQQDLLRNDAEKLRLHAHYLKGSSQVIGAIGVAQCCAALEEAVKNDDIRNFEELFGSINGSRYRRNANGNSGTTWNLDEFSR
jgi:HPt (histidine-containing phosphotransfer) domain-containing protein